MLVIEIAKLAADQILIIVKVVETDSIMKLIYAKVALKPAKLVQIELYALVVSQTRNIII